MEFKKFLQKGFSVLFLDILFVVFGILLLIYFLLSDKETLKALISIFKK